MKRARPLAFAFLFFVLGTAGSLSAQAPAVLPDQMQDDPIASVLDSLYKLDLFEKGYAKVPYNKNPKYNFPKDSVPRYDDVTYESRLARIDAASPFDLQYNSVVR